MTTELEIQFAQFHRLYEALTQPSHFLKELYLALQFILTYVGRESRGLTNAEMALFREEANKSNKENIQ